MALREAARFGAKAAVGMGRLGAFMAAAMTFAAVLGNHERRRIDAGRNHERLGAGENRRIRRSVVGHPLRGVARRGRPLDAAETSRILRCAAGSLRRDRNSALPVRRTSPSSATRSRFRYRRTRPRSPAAPTAKTAFFSTSMFQPIGTPTAAGRCRSSSGSMAAPTNTARAALTIRRPSSPKATSSSSRSTIAWARSAGSLTRCWTATAPTAREITG